MPVRTLPDADTVLALIGGWARAFAQADVPAAVRCCLT